jgi:hypothetical protein
MKVHVAQAIAAACFLQVGCATTDDTRARADTPRDEGVYLTGSRLPLRTTGTAPVSGYSKEGWEEVTRGHKQINPQGK